MKLPPHPKRFGPEWWSVYAAAFVAGFDRVDRVSTFDCSAGMRFSHAERAATVADEAILGFEDAVRGGGINLKEPYRRTIEGE